MAIARATIVNQINNGGKSPKINANNLSEQHMGHIVGQLNFGAFNATTNPNGIQSLTGSDTIVVAEVNKAGVRPSRNNTVGKLVIKSVRAYTNAAITLGTANNLSLRITRGSSSVLAPVTIGNVPESAGLGTANAFIAPVTDINLLVEEGDRIVLVADGALDGSADATDKIFVEVTYKRITLGGRLDQGAASA